VGLCSCAHSEKVEGGKISICGNQFGGRLQNVPDGRPGKRTSRKSGRSMPLESEPPSGNSKNGVGDRGEGQQYMALLQIRTMGRALDDRERLCSRVQKRSLRFVGVVLVVVRVFFGLFGGGLVFLWVGVCGAGGGWGFFGGCDMVWIVKWGRLLVFLFCVVFGL